MKNQTPVRVNEKFRTVLRCLTDSENDGLRNKLADEGLTKPLDVWKEENTLIDGHHRLQLCHDLGIEPHFTYHSFTDEDEAILWILDNQEFSRNQSSIDRIATARVREEIYAKQARARQACGQGGVLLVENLPQASGKTRDHAAAHAGVSGKTYEAGKRVLDLGEPELVQAVRDKKASISAAAEVATLPHEEQQEIVARGEVSQAAKEIREGKQPHVAHNSGNNEWYTPTDIIELARKVMGGIDLDPASCAEANKVVLAARHYSIDDDGLSLPWADRVWMNPPYAGSLISKFCEKLSRHFVEGDITQACVLVNNATETAWFQGLAQHASAICFPRTRVKFWAPGKETAAPLQGQAILYFSSRGQSVDGFRDTFVDIGFVAVL